MLDDLRARRLGITAQKEQLSDPVSEGTASDVADGNFKSVADGGSVEEEFEGPKGFCVGGCGICRVRN